MGQKTNPIGLRLGIIKSWESRWFSEKNYSELLQEDINLRRFLMKRLSSAGISKIVIERPAKLANITLYTSRPGVIIGKKGSDIEKLKKSVTKMVSGDVNINIVEMINKSKNEMAVTLIDINDEIDNDTLKSIETINGIVRVRII